MVFVSPKLMFKRYMLDIITDVSEITWDDPEYFENRAIINAHLDEDGKKSHMYSFRICFTRNWICILLLWN